MDNLGLGSEILFTDANKNWKWISSREEHVTLSNISIYIQLSKKWLLPKKKISEVIVHTVEKPDKNVVLSYLKDSITQIHILTGLFFEQSPYPPLLMSSIFGVS